MASSLKEILKTIEEMVKKMKPGSVVLDMATEFGGNCEVSERGKTIKVHNVTIIGEPNLPSLVATHASEMYAKNLQNLLDLMIVDGELKPDWEDEVLAGSCLTRDGQILHETTRNQVEGE